MARGVVFFLLMVFFARIAGTLDPEGRSEKMEMGSVLIVCNIEGGLGDINWAMCIGEELKGSTTAKITYLFIKGNRSAEEHLKRRGELSGLEAVDCLAAVRAVEDMGYYYKKAVGSADEEGDAFHLRLQTEDLDELLERYDFIVNFHPPEIGEIKACAAGAGRVIRIDEYGEGENQSRVFFRNYAGVYGDMIEEKGGYMRLNVSASEFRGRLPDEKKRNFRLDYICGLERRIGASGYHFVYYHVGNAKQIFDYVVKSLRNTCYYIGAWGGDGDRDAPVLLANIDLRRSAEREVYVKKHGSWDIPEGFVFAGEDRGMVDELLKSRKCVVSGDAATLEVLNTKVRMVSYGSLSPEEFEYLLLKSGYVVGCTGDMSVTQALSSGRMAVYEMLSHKKKFYSHLNLVWKEVLKEEDGAESDLPMIENDLSYFPRRFTAPPGRFRTYRRFLSRLEEDSFQRWFGGRLRSLQHAAE